MQNSPFDILKAKSIWLHQPSGIVCDTTPSLTDRKTGLYLHFDSQGEYKLYKRLVLALPAALVTRSHKLVLLPKTNKYRELAWRVDFAVALAPALVPSIFIEYKGSYLMRSSFNKDALMLRLAMAERCLLPDDRIYIVADAKPVELGHQWRTHSVESIVSLIKGLL